MTMKAARWRKWQSHVFLQTLSAASLKHTAFSRPTAPPRGSAKCLRFGHWLTLCTLNMQVLTYLLT